jgi:hydrogenase expression/formation protein
MDLEGFARRRILKGLDEKQVVRALEEGIREFKDWSRERRLDFSEAVYQEVKASLGSREVGDPFLRSLLSYPESRVTMGDFGVGSRGEGDFYVHRKLAELIGGRAVVGPRDVDDGGVVEADGGYVTLAIDGFHSRLSDFPFVAGFHVARAALRDVQVMGSRPVAMMSDIHLADDGDVGKLFDFTAGVSAVGELTGVPLVSGSTLRIGGDMVFGDRLVAAVGAVGVSERPPRARKNARKGDVILLTRGSGGGTIATIAIYNGFYGVVRETLNVEFHEACEKLHRAGYAGIHAMSDVTNGGIRGDASEISQASGKRLVFYEEALYKAVNPRVLSMLHELDIDPLGISTDSLLIILPEDEVQRVVRTLRRVTKVYEVGRVEEGRGAVILGDSGEERKLEPMFRESPYTRVKKVVGDRKPRNIMKMKSLIDAAWLKSMQKKKEIISYIRRS